MKIGFLNQLVLAYFVLSENMAKNKTAIFCLLPDEQFSYVQYLNDRKCCYFAAFVKCIRAFCQRQEVCNRTYCRCNVTIL